MSLVGSRLAERLNAASLTQTELARRIGVTQGTIAHLIRGRSSGSTHLHRIAQELHTTPGYLSGEIDDPDEGADLGQRLSSDELEWLEIYARMTASQRRLARGLLGELVEANAPSNQDQIERDDLGRADPP